MPAQLYIVEELYRKNNFQDALNREGELSHEVEIDFDDDENHDDRSRKTVLEHHAVESFDTAYDVDREVMIYTVIWKRRHEKII